MGRITQLAGQESSGKTMLALSCIKEYLNKNLKIPLCLLMQSILMIPYGPKRK